MLSEERQGTFVVVPRRSFIFITIIGPVGARVEGGGLGVVVVVVVMVLEVVPAAAVAAAAEEEEPNLEAMEEEESAVVVLGSGRLFSALTPPSPLRRPSPPP